MASSDVGGGRRLVVPNGAGFAPRLANVEVLMAADVSEILAGLSRLEERVSGLTARIDVITASAVTRDHLADLTRRVEALEAGASRVVWMVLTAVMTALLGLVISASILGR